MNARTDHDWSVGGRDIGAGISRVRGELGRRGHRGLRRHLGGLRAVSGGGVAGGLGGGAGGLGAAGGLPLRALSMTRSM